MNSLSPHDNYLNLFSNTNINEMTMFKQMYNNTIYEYFTNACQNNQYDAAKWIVKKNPKHINRYFDYACVKGLNNIIEWIVLNYENVDIPGNIVKYYDDKMFELLHPLCKDLSNKELLENARVSNNIFLIKWLCSIDTSLENLIHNTPINIPCFDHACADAPYIDTYFDTIKWISDMGAIIDYNVVFTEACSKSHFPTINWLYMKEIDIYHDNIRGLRVACMHANYDVIDWFVSIDKDIIHKCNNLIDFIAGCCFSVEKNDMVKYLCSSGLSITNTMFKSACSRRDLKFAKWVYEMGNKYGVIFDIDNAFAISCRQPNNKIAKWLHKLGANINYDNGQAILNACSYGEVPMIKWLLSLGVTMDINKMFVEACKYGNLAIAQYLYKKGANIHVDDNFCFINAYGQFDSRMIQWLSSLCDVSTWNGDVLIWACMINDISLAKKMLASGINNRETLQSAFERACLSNHLEIAKLIYDPNIIPTCKFFDTACFTCTIEIIKYLCDVGVEFNDVEKGFKFALELGRIEILTWLYSMNKFLLGNSFDYVTIETLRVIEPNKEILELYLCLKNNLPFSDNLDQIDDVVVDVLFKQNKMDYLASIKDRFPYIYYEVVDGNVVNTCIKRMKAKSAAK